MFTLAISCLTTSNLPWFTDLTPRFLCNIALYSIRFFLYHQSHPQLGVVFVWLRLFILSGVFISPLISSSILGTYRPGEFIFQCPIFLPFHTVCGVLKAGILKWFAIPFSSEPHFVWTLHHDLSVLGGPNGMAHSFIELDRLRSMWLDWLVFCDCGFQSVCPLMEMDKRPMEASRWDSDWGGNWVLFWWARPYSVNL